MPEPEELTQCPNHDEELNRDSYLSPAFSSHGDILAGLGMLPWLAPSGRARAPAAADPGRPGAPRNIRMPSLHPQRGLRDSGIGKLSSSAEALGFAMSALPGLTTSSSPRGRARTPPSGLRAGLCDRRQCYIQCRKVIHGRRQKWTIYAEMSSSTASATHPG